MTADATRAVLLARPGEARTRLASALDAAGAEVVLAADPSETDPEQVRGLAPRVVLVALEPAIENALDAYEALFSDPAVTVLFDEADVAAQREGWDAARWTRHLSAKLHGRDDVLPPGGEADDDMHPTPGPLQARVEPGELDAALFEGEALELAADVPRDDDYLGPYDAEPGGDAAPEAGSPGNDGDAQADADDGDDLKAMFANLSLVDDQDDAPGDAPDPGADAARGAVVLEGGIGGPDAVRQLLSALPQGFPRPVLVRLQLDGGRYDRLAQQMAKASSMPVLLAEPGQALEPGNVYFLAPNMGMESEPGALRFAESSAPAAELYRHLAAADSALVLLSGSDPALVDGVLEHGGQGALVAAQPASDCYEPTAAAALVERGGDACALGDLAQLLAARWTT
ncbi:chemotaxis protein CheB [Luteimonas vadosa]|uniref:protein-glutamate methylesterase n=1 Tax=Luteimonas vadosa TaxID=1165507 RepID=A0ABP9E9B1_9GAMM